MSILSVRDQFVQKAGPVLRDFLVVWTLMLAPMLLFILVFFLLIPISEPNKLMTWTVGVACIVSGSTGFYLSARWTPEKRWRHISIVAVAVFVVFEAMAFRDRDWSLMGLFSDAFYLALMMMLGGGASYFFKPTDQHPFREDSTV